MKSYKENKESQTNLYNHTKEKVCDYCSQPSQTVFVHGHEQCIFCKINIEPCCQGEYSASSCSP